MRIRPTLAISLGAFLLLVVFVVLAVGYQAFLGARAPITPVTSETMIGGRLSAEFTRALADGDHTLEFQGRTSDGAPLDADVTFEVATAGVREGDIPIIFRTAHENAAGDMYLISYDVAPSARAEIKYRIEGETEWRGVVVSGASDDGYHYLVVLFKTQNPDDLALIRHNPSRPLILSGVPFEFFFPSENTDIENPEKVYRVGICGSAFCRIAPDPANGGPAPENLSATNLRFRSEGGGVRRLLSFTTNERVFLPQMDVQLRPAGTEQWASATQLRHTSASYYRASTDHEIDLYFELRGFRGSGPVFEVRILRADNGTAISGEVFTFQVPGL